MYHSGNFSKAAGMRLLMPLLYVTLFLPILVASTCLTVDPPLPERLSAPRFIHAEIIPKVYDGEIRETIHVQWEPDTTDTIPIYSFQILRKPDTDSLPTPITGIPKTYRDNYDAVYLLSITDRTKNDTIDYWIFAIDTLGRAGDISLVYTVELARAVNLLHPAENDTVTDTTLNIFFRWEVPPIFNQTFSHVILWKSDSLIWASDTVKDFTGGVSKIYQKSRAGTLLPLTPGEYTWGIELIIIGGMHANDPTSVTLRKLYAQ
jgi:hypothetical protein